MHNNKNPCRRAHAENQKSVLLIGVFRVMKHPAPRIVKNALGLFEPNAMFGSIVLILGLVPLESQHGIDSI